MRSLFVRGICVLILIHSWARAEFPLNPMASFRGSWQTIDAPWEKVEVRVGTIFMVVGHEVELGLPPRTEIQNPAYAKTGRILPIGIFSNELASEFIPNGKDVDETLLRKVMQYPCGYIESEPWLIHRLPRGGYGADALIVFLTEEQYREMAMSLREALKNSPHYEAGP